MRFAVNALNFGLHGTAETLAAWARNAEDAGFHAVMISDHVAVTPDVAEQYPAPFFDPFATLAWLAAQTERVRLGTTVAILPYRSPLLTARMAANIDHFSGGRLILGVGISWPEQEYAALDVPFSKRGRIADDYLAAITELWTRDTASIDTPSVSFSDVQTGPRPVQDPHPPIWVGGNSRAAATRAARFGSGWHPINVTPGWLAEEGMPMLRAAAEREGRPVPALQPRIALPQEGLDAGALRRVREDLLAFEDLGADYVLFDSYAGTPERQRPFADDWAMFATLAERVLDLDGGTVR
ncbi:TIGR03619 family F420-dependent LLM class oxidoreductase [Streptomonospora wellingtoniae]|uniref:TIGR03619 family F420-dependent LLM class oxidoreductase n=1 Tax=Streptomonospora wellingtoniae TaxID=3075544 RepID=A0ABU2L0Z3_9ACTN|nr:TIGR03619 family F420-dependent LLM class oxidoreductase [Streptomonospora sp. DSM 45055]MDT0305224.1 TIGR03619 family F420-dependent LLM class oxidoreductase [Streptomonospora sp. DSM 45055]